MVSYSRRLLSEIEWTGPAQLAWMKTPDGEFKLMEINGRFWRTLQLSIFCGVNFPCLAAAMYEGGKIEPDLELQYPEGLKLRSPLDGLLSVLSDRSNLSRRLVQYLNALDVMNPRVHYSFSLMDPAPHIYTISFEVLDRLVTKLMGTSTTDIPA
ncbi:MAG: hypothetical protein GX600_00845 [Dehalococcoidia bacterium]|nr:hypothetical protein [Dehalococcoidia bacterium]